MARKNKDRSKPIAKSKANRTKPKKEYFLVLCMAEKTEPNYFEELKAELPREVLDLNVERDGKKAPDAMLEKAETLKQTRLEEKGRKPPYDEIWLVFDADDFKDNFTQAIKDAEEQEEKGFRVAWSNEAFEFWFLLHFHRIETGIQREQYEQKLNTCIRNHEPGFEYKKNMKGMYARLKQYGDMAQACRFASEGYGAWEKSDPNRDYFNWRSCTTVDQLIKRLKPDLE